MMFYRNDDVNVGDDDDDRMFSRRRIMITA